MMSERLLIAWGFWHKNFSISNVKDSAADTPSAEVALVN
jgi:hypothetical protein